MDGATKVPKEDKTGECLNRWAHSWHWAPGKLGEQKRCSTCGTTKEVKR